MLDNRTNLSKCIKSTLRSSYGSLIPFFNVEIPLVVKIAESTQYGKSILKYDKNSKAAIAYSLLAEEILENERRKKIKTTNIR